MTSVVLWRTADVPSVDTVWSPCFSFFGIFIHDHFCAEGCQRRFVVIKRAVELRFGRKARVDMRLPEEVQRCGGLFYEPSPQVQRKVWVAAAQDRDEMVLESPNGFLGRVVSV